ncbi:NADP(H)-dependent aldo-keto reductase [Neisseria chenwenguii]|uniref:Protein tas n=1 Tax=Neisseria chenwenguii TaxID=1853278 RepID=A0A220S422_9NEIS|nr:NADP(H)-dependent aldo-keto reductase [Neisseria chenwenguii]ASK28152.1 NADP(H)-dependent aldo-keto reductase [Neisseria chenwenguii]ROV57304.1 NADP(H)-dependent aldo-keto reductase [Neisseria chenwenguii]
MEQRTLGTTGIQVSKICLGTMTWGEQNTEAEAHQQLDYALAHGVNFIDTAEMYPVPPRKETYATTERYIGSWIKARGKRDDFVLASKIAGPTANNANGLDPYIRNGNDFSRAQIFEACEASLKRLNTDYLDLYQLHWPERQANYFGRLGIDKLPENETFTPFEEITDALNELVRQGKIRAFGLSNETPWGVMQYLAQHQKRPETARVASIQNPYSLLNRSYEVGLSEISLRENLPLLAYSPLAFGVLTGKYRHGAMPEGSRLALFSRFRRYNKPQGFAAVERYAQIAEEAGLSLTALALAFVNGRPFVASNIIGATSLEQLAENIASAEVILSADVLAAIDAVHAEISNPCP